MIKGLAIFVIVIMVFIFGITMFLSPNSLSNCSDMPSSIKGCGAADAIVAVSGGDTSSRAQTAIDLYKNGWAPLIIFSGAAADKTGPSNAEAMKAQAIAQDVPSSAIRIEESSENTYENAQKTAKIFETEGVKSAILVTSSYHQKRVALEFSSQSPDVEFRSFPSKTDHHWSAWWWLTPYGWYLAVSETMKIIIFYTGGTV